MLSITGSFFSKSESGGVAGLNLHGNSTDLQWPTGSLQLSKHPLTAPLDRGLWDSFSPHTIRVVMEPKIQGSD